MHSKDAQGPVEHAGLRTGALRRRVYELRLPLAVPVSVEGITRRGDMVEFCQYPQKDAQGPGEHAEPRIEALRRRVYVTPSTISTS